MQQCCRQCWAAGHFGEKGPDRGPSDVLTVTVTGPQAATTPAAGVTWRLYYYAGAQRVAERVLTANTDTLYFMHGDHLGSTSLVTCGNTSCSPGSVIARQRYYPFGSVRPGGTGTVSAATPTDHTFTGQTADASTGLMYYVARYYDPLTGRFISADTIVPQPGNPQSLNRYAYSFNNPVRYTDPSGHSPCSGLLGAILGALGACPTDPGSIVWGDPRCGDHCRATPEVYELCTDCTKPEHEIFLPCKDCSGPNETFDPCIDCQAKPHVTTIPRDLGPQIHASESNVGFVYRGLAQDEDPSKGLVARAPGAGNTPRSHVAGKRESQWISTTKDPEVAFGRFGEFGVVEIDLARVTSQVIDLSQGFPGKKDMLSNWARKFQEVLVQDYIPPEAITRYWEPS